jgi:hypothetical protein
MPFGKLFGLINPEGDLWEIAPAYMKASERSGDFPEVSKDTEFLNLKIEYLPKAMMFK